MDLGGISKRVKSSWQQTVLVLLGLSTYSAAKWKEIAHPVADDIDNELCVFLYVGKEFMELESDGGKVLVVKVERLR